MPISQMGIEQILDQILAEVTKELTHVGIGIDPKNGYSIKSLTSLDKINFDVALAKVYQHIRSLPEADQLSVMVTIMRIYDSSKELDSISRGIIKGYLWLSSNVPNIIKKNLDLLDPYPQQMSYERDERAGRLLNLIKSTPQAISDMAETKRIKEEQNEDLHIHLQRIYETRKDIQESKARRARDLEHALGSKAAPEVVTPKPEVKSKSKTSHYMPKIPAVFKKEKSVKTQESQKEARLFQQQEAEAKLAYAEVVLNLKQLATKANAALSSLLQHQQQKLTEEAATLKSIIAELEPRASIADLDPDVLMQRMDEVIEIGQKILDTNKAASKKEQEPAMQNKSNLNSFRENFVDAGKKLLASFSWLIEALSALKTTILQKLGYGSKSNDADVVANKKGSLFFGETAAKKPHVESAQVLSNSKKTLERLDHIKPI